MHRQVWGVGDAQAELLDDVRRGDALVFCNEELTEILGIYGVVDDPFADKERITTSDGLDVTEAFAHRVQLEKSCLAGRAVDMKKLLPVLNLVPDMVDSSGKLEERVLIPLKVHDYRIIRRELESPVTSEQEFLHVPRKPSRRLPKWTYEDRTAGGFY